MTIKHSIQVAPNVVCDYTIEELTTCPLCKRAIKPEELNRVFSRIDNYFGQIAYIYKCHGCHQLFFAVYLCQTYSDGNIIGVRSYYLAPDNFAERVFEEKVSELSPRFVEIYNEALRAETEKLDEIAGVGFRKALEFLIKDFLIHLYPGDVEAIVKMELGNCIANKVENKKLQAVASRSAWIGNDFAHYQKRFEDKDIKDMHMFIDAALYWINAELISDDALKIEPRGRS